MTVSTTASNSVVQGNAATTTFSFSFIAAAAADIEVLYTNTSNVTVTLSPASYTLVINAPAAGQLWGIGGTVTYPLVGSPIANGTSLTIQRTVPLTQVITISNQGDFAPQVIEEALDTLEFQIQQVSARTTQFRGTWLTATSYNYGDIVQDGSNGLNTKNYYICQIANTSSVWATDLAAGDWALSVAALVPAGPITNAQLAAMAANTIKVNATNASATPTDLAITQSTLPGRLNTGNITANSISAYLDDFSGNTQGNILYRSAVSWISLAPGVAGQKLITGGGSANPSWITGNKVGNTTYDLSTATGTLSITGVGFKPAGITMLMNVDGGGRSCTGFSDGATHRCMNTTAASTWTGTAALARMLTDGSNFVDFVINSFNADGFTLGITKTGSPTGTANISYHCIT